ncbi:MAG: hypothetical protein IKQ94_09010 [Bacteroidales bacterium]|nr:hypothetical protein [Bacteroidales bacterium]
MEEEIIIQTPTQPTPMSVPAVDEGREVLRKSGKLMLIAAIVQSVLVMGLYIGGILAGNVFLRMYDYLYVPFETLTAIYMLMIASALLLVPPTALMFCYAFSSRKAANGNEKALVRSTKHIKIYFMISAIMTMVALFAMFVIMLFHLWINSL